MPVLRHRRGASGGTSHGTRWFISGPPSGVSLGPLGVWCDGYGDPVGLSGGYGMEESGYGDPCRIGGLYVVGVQVESLAESVISGLPRSTRNWVNEFGGQTVVVRSTSPVAAGVWSVEVRPYGTARRQACYSGVAGQRNQVVLLDDEVTLSFVIPSITSIGAADLYLTCPRGEVFILPAGIEIVPASERSLRRFLSVLTTKRLAGEGRSPTVVP